MTSRYTFALAAGLLALAPLRAHAQGPDPLEGAVQSYAPGTSLSSDPSLLHRADFNGDGNEDVAAVVESGGKSALVIFNATQNGYRAYPLYANLPPGPWRVDVVPPGRHRVLGAEGAVDLSSPAIELVFPGRSSAMYVWRGNRYQVFGTESH